MKQSERIYLEMQNRQLGELLTGAARNCWLAISADETRIVGKGNTLEEAVEAARKNGEDDPLVMWAPKTWNHAIYAAKDLLKR